jgi:hypothetical protein
MARSNVILLAEMFKKGNFIKFIFVYLVVFYSLAGVMFLGLKSHFKQNFSEGKLEKMISAKSAWREMTTDLCNFQIYGDPVDAGKAYVKVNFECADGRSSKNTLSLIAIKDKTFEGIMTEFARIIGFDPKIVTDKGSVWKCSIDNQEVVDRKMLINEQATINCK